MSRIHPIAKYLLVQLGIAIALPIVGVATAIALDVAGLGTLLAQSQSPGTGVMAMIATSVSVFAPLIFTTAVMLLAE